MDVLWGWTAALHLGFVYLWCRLVCYISFRNVQQVVPAKKNEQARDRNNVKVRDGFLNILIKD